LQTAVDGESVFEETHSATTNAFGLINLDIGWGSVSKGEFSEISWGTDKYFLMLEMDPSGGSNFQMMGVAQLLSVPYALFAGNGVQFDPDLECNESTEGTIRYNFDTKVFEFCDGSSWIELGSGTGPFNCGEPLVDIRDGQVYATVKIGTQCWMAENLNYGVYVESVFTNDVHSDVSNNGIVEKYAQENDTSYLAVYGGLYDWNELMNYTTGESGQGICPDGWHVPSHAELVELVDAVGGFLGAGKALKMGGSSGFNFPMGGNRLGKGNFSGVDSGSIWNTTISGSHPDTRAWNIYFIQNADNASQATDLMVVGKSCRCVKN